MNTQENIKMIRNVDKENLNGLVEIIIKVNIRMMKGMVMVRCNGLMVADT